MAQKQKHSVVEAVIHAVMGFLIGFTVVLLLDIFGSYIGFEINVDWWQNILISAIIVVFNTIKAYLIRRFFSRYER